LTSELFAELYARGRVAAELGDAAWVRAMLDVEAALARACAAEGLIPASSAQEIAAACVEPVPLGPLRDGVGDSATPVIALVRELRERLGESARPHVHVGATSQDILDTALMLMAQRALRPLLDDAAACARAAAGLADRHRATAMIGRTLLAQAVATTFGLRAAVWLDGIDEALGALRRVRDNELAVQLGGPVGAGSPALARRVAAELGLAEPALPWHAMRVRPAALACALGALCGVLSKIARDVTLLAQQEVGECSEGPGPDPGRPRGGSSAMAHKRNPVASVAVIACARRAPGLVATILACMEQEHERAAGAWQAEWATHTELLALAGSAAAWGRDLLEGLKVDPERMRRNLAEAPAGSQSPPEAASELIDRALAAHEAAEQREAERARAARTESPAGARAQSPAGARAQSPGARAEPRGGVARTGSRGVA